MSASPIFARASESRYGGPRFVLVNNRTPRAETQCALCGGKIADSYIRETQTRLFYCDTKCFAGRAKVARFDVKKREREVSWTARILTAITE
jgi:hypothetical protein